MTDTYHWDEVSARRLARELPVLRLDEFADEQSPLPKDADFAELERHLQGKALLFLSRGVVHKMNNVLAVFMSLTQLVGLRGPGRSPIRQAQDLGPYQASVDQGLSVMSLLSDLSPGEVSAAGSAVCVGPLLQTLAQTLLCEEAGARYPVVSLNQPQVYTSLPRCRLNAALLLLIEHVLREGCRSFRGRLELRAEEWEGQPSIRVRFRLPEDHLPFSIDRLPISPEFLEYCRELRLGITALEGEPGYRLLLPSL